MSMFNDKNGEQLPATQAPDHFALAKERIDDLYPKYRDWTLSTLTLDVDYAEDTGVRTCELPDDQMGCILQSPDGTKHVFVTLPQILLDTPTNDGPRITPDDLVAALAEGDPVFLVLPGTLTTACILTFKDGHTVMGTAACIARENFSWVTGKRLAKDRAIDAAFAVLAARKRVELFRHAHLAAESVRA